MEVVEMKGKKSNSVRVFLICENHVKFCKIAIKWLCYSQLSDRLTAGNRQQVCLAGISPASREHPCDMATWGSCDYWASSERVNCEREELSAGMRTVQKVCHSSKEENAKKWTLP